MIRLNKSILLNINLKKVIKFQVVAWIGTVLNLCCLWLLHGKFNIHLLLSATISVELAIIHNFSWHYFTTWKDRVNQSVKDYFQRLIKYNIITASIDFITNLGILWSLVTFFELHYMIANLIAMTLGPLFKFIANEFLIFKRKISLNNKLVNEEF